MSNQQESLFDYIFLKQNFPYPLNSLVLCTISRMVKKRRAIIIKYITKIFAYCKNIFVNIIFIIYLTFKGVVVIESK